MTAAETTPPMTSKTAMQANELRLGNYVKAPLGEIMRIDVLGHLDNPNYIHASNETGFGQNGFEPIELTPEILEKAGFVKEERGKDCDFDGVEIVYNLNGVDIYDITNGDTYFVYATYTRYPGRGFKAGFPVKSLHQLQNLYFVLTGEELPLTL